MRSSQPPSALTGRRFDRVLGSPRGRAVLAPPALHEAVDPTSLRLLDETADALASLRCGDPTATLELIRLQKESIEQKRNHRNIFLHEAGPLGALARVLEASLLHENAYRLVEAVRDTLVRLLEAVGLRNTEADGLYRHAGVLHVVDAPLAARSVGDRDRHQPLFTVCGRAVVRPLSVERGAWSAASPDQRCGECATAPNADCVETASVTRMDDDLELQTVFAVWQHLSRRAHPLSSEQTAAMWLAVEDMTYDEAVAFVVPALGEALEAVGIGADLERRLIEWMGEPAVRHMLDERQAGRRLRWYRAAGGEPTRFWPGVAADVYTTVLAAELNRGDRAKAALEGLSAPGVPF